MQLSLTYYSLDVTTSFCKFWFENDTLIQVRYCHLLGIWYVFVVDMLFSSGFFYICIYIYILLYIFFYICIYICSTLEKTMCLPKMRNSTETLLVSFRIYVIFLITPVLLLSKLGD